MFLSCKVPSMHRHECNQPSITPDITVQRMSEMRDLASRIQALLKLFM